MPDEHPPAGGWETPQDPAPDLDALTQLLRAALEFVPADVQARLVDAVRELLRALRALLEWWIDRLEPRERAGRPAEVRDIPIL